ncbi:hypothetical protein, partial [Paraburkholderia sabiae]|uniref:hypothetical protein n=1 Tax=Paraburkholderia sabiae TaxID=273251 RepID=UPI001CC6A495
SSPRSLKYPHPRIVHAHVSARTFADLPLLFFAAAKKSRYRPAQGRRLKYEYEFADASKKQKNKKRKNQNGD